ncbi:MAG: cytochrome P450 [Chitinophagaceae bacterium]
MDKWAVLSLSKKILRPYKHAAVRAARRMLPQKKQLLFVFGGRTHYWPGMGRELYENEPVFRQSIRQCDAYINELTGSGILSNFEGPPDHNFFENETRLALTLISLQVAMSDLWRSKGIIPNATMGISLGEVAGVYMAGGLQLKDVMRLAVECASIHELEQREFVPVYLQANRQNAKALADRSPVFLSTIYESGNEGMLALFHKEDKQIIADFLNKEGIAWSMPHKETIWPYHTQMITKHREALSVFTNQVEALPLQCDYYSALLGTVIPAGSIIDNSYWFNMKHRPVLAHSALQAAGKAGLDVMVSAGAQAIAKAQAIRSIGNRNVVLMDSIREGEPEMNFFQTAQRRLSALKFRKQLHKASGDPVHDFIQRFSLNNPIVQQDPYPHLRFLKKQGSVHYLPAHNAWIVLDYDEIEFVLKQPQIFSSTLHKTFDECLVGSDPPDHTLVRSLLQPLFSPQVFTELGNFTTAHAGKLLDQLAKQDQFNVADAFSLPLAQAVVAKFLGLSPQDEQALQKCIHGHVYAMEYVDDLYTFFKQYLERANEEENNAAGLLMRAVKENKVSAEGAVKLMRLLWVAGMTTTSMLISTAVYFAAKDPGLAAQLRENDQLIPKFIEECLRLEAPESELKRITTKEVKLGNAIIPAGAIVMLGMRAANRDGQYFDDADTISFDRPVKRHLSFGGGYHYCLGVGMARLEAKYALKMMLDRLPGLRLNDEQPPTWFPSPHFRGLAKLIVCTDNNKA